MRLSARQVGELEARDFWGDDVWRRWKTDYDNCMAFRKTLKGKPTDEQKAVLEMNNAFIDFYTFILFHSPRLASSGQCDCGRCGKLRSAKK